MSDRSNEDLANLLDIIVVELYSDHRVQLGETIEEAADRLRDIDNIVQAAQLQYAIDIVKFMRTYQCDADIIEQQFAEPKAPG